VRTGLGSWQQFGVDEKCGSGPDALRHWPASPKLDVCQDRRAKADVTTKRWVTDYGCPRSRSKTEIRGEGHFLAATPRRQTGEKLAWLKASAVSDGRGWVTSRLPCSTSSPVPSDTRLNWARGTVAIQVLLSLSMAQSALPGLDCGKVGVNCHR